MQSARAEKRARDREWRRARDREIENRWKEEKKGKGGNATTWLGFIFIFRFSTSLQI